MESTSGVPAVYVLMRLERKNVEPRSEYIGTIFNDSKNRYKNNPAIAMIVELIIQNENIYEISLAASSFDACSSAAANELLNGISNGLEIFTNSGIKNRRLWTLFTL